MKPHVDDGTSSQDPSVEAGLLQDVRIEELGSRIASLIHRYAPRATRALDVGAQHGEMALRLVDETGISFTGIEPFLSLPTEDHGAVKVIRAGAEDIPYPEGSFDLVTLISVYEHFAPSIRRRCISEIHRVLKPEGVLIGQIPNMYYPIESHSRLPFQSYLPARVGEKYVLRFSKTPWRHVGVNWYRVGPKMLRADATAAGFRDPMVLRSNYSINAVPRRFRRFYPLTRAFPLNFDFVFRKVERTTASDRS